MNVWRLIAHHENPADAIQLMKQKNRIAIGWSAIGNLFGILPTNQSVITKAITQAYPDLDNANLGGPSLWNLYAKMKEGDFVILSAKGKRDCVFEVTGPYFFEDGENGIFEYRHQRPAHLTDIDPEALWRSLDPKFMEGQNQRWTLAACSLSNTAQEVICPEERRECLKKTDYSQFINERNLEGSNKASSYIRSLELLDGILKRDHLFGHLDFWSIESVAEINRLYEYSLEFQKKEGSEFLQADLPPSYGRNGYYSAALKSYKEFLILNQHESRLWNLVNELDVQPSELSKRMDAEKVDSIEALIEDRELDFSTKEGKEVLRETKARVNQGFFRKMLLATYETKCCVCGLNIPEVLRASHIVAWSDDKKNRLNPTNGLCLSATYDAAFDRHLISFDEDCRMIFSPTLKEYYSNDAFKTQFAAFEGKPISKPKRFCPDQEFLQKHRSKMPV